jgi:hypothetical protein
MPQCGISSRNIHWAENVEALAAQIGEPELASATGSQLVTDEVVAIAADCSTCSTPLTGTANTWIDIGQYCEPTRHPAIFGRSPDRVAAHRSLQPP